jgi:hypothetical protein
MRDMYIISNSQSIEDIEKQLNVILQRIGDRLDQIEGVRGNPQFFSTTFEWPNGGLTVGQVLKVLTATTVGFGADAT